MRFLEPFCCHLYFESSLELYHHACLKSYLQVQEPPNLKWYGTLKIVSEWFGQFQFYFLFFIFYFLVEGQNGIVY